MLSLGFWVLGNIAAIGFAVAALVFVTQMAYAALNVWAAILVLILWPVSIIVGSIVAAIVGAWLPLVLLVLAALSAFFGWLLCLLFGWN